jgi:flagellar hook-associated protein 3 FlgL
MDAMRQIRGSLEGDLDRIVGIQGEVGTKIDWFLMEQEQITADRAQIEKLKSSVLDTDITEATLDLQKDQVVYEVALKTGANLVQMTLLDYL